MDFLPSILAQTQNYLNSSNAIYLNDVTLKAVDDGNIVGFICENLTPIRFVGVLDFGVGSDVFEEYMTFRSLTSLTFIYNNDTTTLPDTSTGDGAITTKPYLETSGDIILRQDENKQITLTGGNFDPSIVVDFGPQVTVNGFDSITDQQMIVNVTAGSANQDSTSMVMTRGDVQSFGNSVSIMVTDQAIGTGNAGTYEWGFSNGGTGYGAFDGNWTLEIYNGIDSIDGFFKTSDAGTPSNGTGPTSGYDGYYLFTERSGDNYGSGKYGQITTTNFRILTEISFYYHMYGGAIGDLIIQSKDNDGLWTERWKKSGEQQSNQDDPFLYTGALDTTSWDAVAIRIVFGEALNYDGDIAIDKIKLVSI